MVQAPNRIVRTRAFITYSDFDDALQDAEATERPALLAARDTAGQLAHKLGCFDQWKRAQGVPVTWCETAALYLDVRSVLALADSSGLWRLDTRAGHHPLPPAERPGHTGPGCRDITGVDLTIETLEATSYRHSYLGCLDAPDGDPLFEQAARLVQSIRTGLWQKPLAE